MLKFTGAGDDLGGNVAECVAEVQKVLQHLHHAGEYGELRIIVVNGQVDRMQTTTSLKFQRGKTVRPGQ